MVMNDEEDHEFVSNNCSVSTTTTIRKEADATDMERSKGRSRHSAYDGHERSSEVRSRRNNTARRRERSHESRGSPESKKSREREGSIESKRSRDPGRARDRDLERNRFKGKSRDDREASRDGTSWESNRRSGEKAYRSRSREKSSRPKTGDKGVVLSPSLLHESQKAGGDELDSMSLSQKARRKRRSGWDDAPSPPRSVVGSGASPGMTILTTKSPEEIQLELSQRQAQAANIAAMMQTKAAQSQMCRIYVGSLDYALTEQDVKQVFQAFGSITNIDMPKEGSRSKGFCFVEYTTPESAEMALTTMQGFQLKGRSTAI